MGMPFIGIWMLFISETNLSLYKFSNQLNQFITNFLQTSHLLGGVFSHLFHIYKFFHKYLVINAQYSNFAQSKGLYDQNNFYYCR